MLLEEKMLVLGIDLRSTPKHPSAIAALNGGPEVTVAYLDRVHTDDDIVRIAETLQPSLIAIGTPLGLPEGLCCLETTCACKFHSPQQKGRQLEVELAHMGISCFFTNKGSIIRILIYRAIALSRRLIELGFEVIEVYPHATKVVLFGDSVPPKNSSGNLGYMKVHLPHLIGGLDPFLESMDRYTCDALINGYTALLHSRDDTDLLGNPQEGGLLALPKLFPDEGRSIA
jgi:predicted nuclease with RNAse H fold